MTLDPGEVLQEVLNNGLPCELTLSSYNDALSLQAHLNRYIRNMKSMYAHQENPFEGLDVLLMKPKTLRFEQRGKLKLRQVGDLSPE